MSLLIPEIPGSILNRHVFPGLTVVDLYPFRDGKDHCAATSKQTWICLYDFIAISILHEFIPFHFGAAVESPASLICALTTSSLQWLYVHTPNRSHGFQPTANRRQFNVYSKLVQHNLVEMKWKQHLFNQCVPSGGRRKAFLMKLVERMPRVCIAVIKAKGGYFEESPLYFDVFKFFGCYMIPCVIL